MTYRQIGFEFKEIKADFKARKSLSAPSSYKAAAGTSFEAPSNTKFTKSGIAFPELDIFNRHQEGHEIIIGSIPVKISNSGVISYDALLNKDPNLLYNFFLYHNTAPKLFIDIKGYHTEYTLKTYNGTNSYGEYILEEVWDDVEVVDFTMSFDASEYIYPAGALHLISPMSRPKDYYAIRDMSWYFERYTQSTFKVKDIQLEKNIQWDFEGLTNAILYSIRSQGYRDKVNISYRRENYEVKVVSESKVAKLYQSKFMNALCVLTCCCLIFAPFARIYDDYLCVKMRYPFKMSISAQDWYKQNIFSILRKAKNRYGCGKRLVGSAHGSSSKGYSTI